MGTTTCSRCKAWINDREWRCRSCGKLLPGLFGQRRWLDTVFSRSRSQARTLLVVLVACFLLELLVSQFSPNEGERPHFTLDPTGLGMLRSGAVYAMGRNGGPNPLMRSEPWRLVTAMLLHGGVFHILMNGLSLLSLGVRRGGVRAARSGRLPDRRRGNVGMLCSSLPGSARRAGSSALRRDPGLEHAARRPSGSRSAASSASLIPTRDLAARELLRPRLRLRSASWTGRCRSPTASGASRTACASSRSAASRCCSPAPSARRSRSRPADDGC
jgi:hypothetical protein